MLNYKSIAIDTETTGLDLYHSCKPFFVTICDCDDNQVYFEWDVNPLNRQPIVPEEDILTLQSIIKEAEQLVFHNAKFDVTALNVLDKRILKHFNWNKVVDTLIADHLLYSNQRRDLTTLGVRYLGINIDKQEIALDKAVLRARLEVRKEDTVLEKRDTILPLEEEELRKAKMLFKSNPNKRLAKKILNLELEIKRLKAMKSKFHGWIISEKNLEDNPSINSGAKLGKSDMWLPRAIYKVLNDNLKKEYQHWDTVLSEYANTDSAITMGVWKIQEHQIERRKLGKIFKERMKLLPITRYIESKGITVNSNKLLQQKLDYIKESEEYKNVCESIAKSYGEEFSNFQMPKSGRSQKLNDFMLSPNGLSLVSNKTSKKTGNPSLDKEALEAIYNELKALEPDSNRTTFIHSLLEKSKRDTAINYMEGYQRFWVETGVKDWYVLHPSLNPTGTDTLRWSSKNPNSQNASRKEGFNLRKSFGPMPDREWYSLDAKNLELRIPAYEAKEQIMIDLFEKPNDPPYFGSNHLVVAHLLYKKEFEECINSDGIVDGRLFKEKYNRTLYHYVKLGNFSVQYRAVNKPNGMGTADRAYRVVGGQTKVEKLFTKITELNNSWIKFANKNGYIETIPDKTVDPERGYPLVCPKKNGFISPTIPFNFHIQGTACWWMMKAMIRCHDQLSKWKREDGFSGFMCIQIHDELVFDFPKSKVDPIKEINTNEKKSNLWRILKIKKLMEKGGDDIGIPIPVSCEYHPVCWSEGITIC